MGLILRAMGKEIKKRGGKGQRQTLEHEDLNFKLWIRENEDQRKQAVR